MFFINIEEIASIMGEIFFFLLITYKRFTFKTAIIVKRVCCRNYHIISSHIIFGKKYNIENICEKYCASTKIVKRLLRDYKGTNISKSSNKYIIIL